MLLAGRKGYVPSRRAGRGKDSGSREEEVGALQEAERGIPQPRRTTTATMMVRMRPSDTVRCEQQQQVSSSLVRWTRPRTADGQRIMAHRAGGGSDATTGGDGEALANNNSNSTEL